MNYQINGNLTGFLWEDSTRPILPSEILIYLPWQKEQGVTSTHDSTKGSFRVVTNRERDIRKDLLLARSKSNEKGNFEFFIDEKYAKNDFDIDFVCNTLPYVQSVQFHLTTFRPYWHKENEDHNFYNWKYCISSKWWCYINGHYLDAWVVCNHLRNCETSYLLKTPYVQHEMQMFQQL